MTGAPHPPSPPSPAWPRAWCVALALALLHVGLAAAEPPRIKILGPHAEWRRSPGGRYTLDFRAPPAKITGLMATLRHTTALELRLNGELLARVDAPQRKLRGDGRVLVGLPASHLVAGGLNKLEVHSQKGRPFRLTLYGRTGLQLLRGPFVSRIGPRTATVTLETGQRTAVTLDWHTAEGLRGQVRSAPRQPAALHRLRIDGLAPGLEVSYRLTIRGVDGPGKLEAGPFTLYTPAPRHQPFRFVIYGDTRTRPDSHRQVVAQILRFKPELALHTGDITMTGTRYKPWGPEWFEPGKPLLGSAAIMIAPGNHDAHNELYEWYASRWPTHRDFVLDWGDVRFIGVDTGSSYKAGSPQYKRLERALETAGDRWRVVLLHHAPYSCVPARIPGHMPSRQHLVPLFEKYKVDVVFTGHDHVYARTKPINGVIYVVSGGGGAPTYPTRKQSFNEICESVHHIVAVTVAGDLMKIRAVDTKGRDIDLTYVRKRPVP